MSRSIAWSDDRVAILKSLWLDGLSAAQVAQRLGGVSRSAVIGKIHRLGLGGRAASSKPTRTPRIGAPLAPRRARAKPHVQTPAPTSVRAPRTALAPARPAAPPPAGPGLVSDLVLLGAHACKWPIGDPHAPNFSFCGRHAEGRYCPAHAAHAVRPDPGRRKKGFVGRSMGWENGSRRLRSQGD